MLSLCSVFSNPRYEGINQNRIDRTISQISPEVLQSNRSLILTRGPYSVVVSWELNPIQSSVNPGWWLFVHFETAQSRTCGFFSHLDKKEFAGKSPTRNLNTFAWKLASPISAHSLMGTVSCVPPPPCPGYLMNTQWADWSISSLQWINSLRELCVALLLIS